MRIVFPLVFYLPDTVGGIEWYTHHLAKALLAAGGYEVAILVPDFEGHFPAERMYDGVRVVHYRAAPARTRTEFSGITPNASLPSFIAALQALQPDVVHFSQLTNSAGIALHHIRAAKKLGCKIVYTNHLSELFCLRGDFYKLGKTPCRGIVSTQHCAACAINRKPWHPVVQQAARYVDAAYNAVTSGIGHNGTRGKLAPLMPGFAARWQRQKVKELLAITDAFVSVAQWFDDLLRAHQLHTPRCSIIPTGLLPGAEPTAATIHEKPAQQPVRVLFAGRFYPIKGADLAIEAVRHLPATLITLHLYGQKDGGMHAGYFDRWHALAASSPHIAFFEPLTNTALQQLLPRYDLLLLPSRAEMAPLIIQEALAAGVPVVGAHIPGIAEMIRHGENGWLFERNNPVALQQLLMEICTHPEQLTAIRKRIVPPRPFSEVAAAYRQLYQQLHVTPEK